MPPKPKRFFTASNDISTGDIVNLPNVTAPTRSIQQSSQLKIGNKRGQFKDVPTAKFFSKVKNAFAPDAYQRLLDVQYERGNPTISVGKGKGLPFSHNRNYNPFNNNIEIPTNEWRNTQTGEIDEGMMKQGLIDDYLSEVAHAGQGNVIGKWLANDLPAWVKSKYYGQPEFDMPLEELNKAINADPYEKEGTVENYTHKILEPKLRKYVFGETPKMQHGGTVMPTKVKSTNVSKKPTKVRWDEAAQTYTDAGDYYDKYDKATEWSYLTDALRPRLREKNPTNYDAYVKAMAERRNAASGNIMNDKVNQLLSGRIYGDLEAERFPVPSLTDEEVAAQLKTVKPYGDQTDLFKRYKELQGEYFGKTASGNMRAENNPLTGFNLNEMYTNAPSSYGSSRGEYYRPRIEDGRFVVDTNLTRDNVGSYATGSSGVPTRDVNLTKGEFVITPKGTSVEIGGKPGVDENERNVPVGSIVFSDKIKFQGKTMAERAKLRAKREKLITDILEEDGQDMLSKNTLKRTVKQNKVQETNDLLYQDIAAGRPPMPIEEEGEGMQPVEQPAEGEVQGYQWGTDEEGVDDEYERGNWLRGLPRQGQVYSGGNQGRSWFEDDIRNPYPGGAYTSTYKLGPSAITPYEESPAGAFINSSTTPNKYTGNMGMNPMTGNIEGYNSPNRLGNIGMTQDNQIDYMPDTTRQPTAGIYGGKTGGPLKTETYDQYSARQGEAKTPPVPDASNDAMWGNVIGSVGMGINAIGPLLSTIRNARATKPVENRYRGFGNKALEMNTAAEDALNFGQNEARINNAISRNTQGRSATDSTRSLNVGRALRSMVDFRADQAEQGLDADFAGKRAGVISERGRLSTEKDRMEMTGQTAADTANAQNVDNFYTNLNKDLGNLGTSVQQFGRNLNQDQYNKDMMQLLGDLSKYGIRYKRDKKGTLIQTIE